MKIVNNRQLAATAYMEGIESEYFTEKHVTILPGIVDPYREERGVAIMNTGEHNITLYPGTPIARCTSSYEAKYGSSHEVAMVHTVYTDPETLAEEKNACKILLHLQEMYEKSTVFLNE